MSSYTQTEMKTYEIRDRNEEFSHEKHRYDLIVILKQIHLIHNKYSHSYSNFLNMNCGVFHVEIPKHVYRSEPWCFIETIQ